MPITVSIYIYIYICTLYIVPNIEKPCNVNLGPFNPWAVDESTSVDQSRVDIVQKTRA